ncbi:hypothetical protein AMTR_s00110p00082690 [Amborella trichopoda]|uniref:Uncharacterized protein n=1 Tax=Amborella trichopoda TaxID=13333 RepID=W1NX44_AMBTC|nr:hypothetical protein AMTR_s00110p00082690 [Amborella trichopoda]
MWSCGVSLIHLLGGFCRSDPNGGYFGVQLVIPSSVVALHAIGYLMEDELLGLFLRWKIYLPQDS